MERIVERVDSHIPVQPRALRVCAYARVSSGKDAMLHSLSAQVSYYCWRANAGGCSITCAFVYQP